MPLYAAEEATSIQYISYKEMFVYSDTVVCLPVDICHRTGSMKRMFAGLAPFYRYWFSLPGDIPVLVHPTVLVPS